ncbi:hypothetical protein C8J56DRAFT_1049511 [Mycena floridula]|nr:hypothetical protein C8J56DRAFT_1049511 [Mycena floridula]
MLWMQQGARDEASSQRHPSAPAYMLVPRRYDLPFSHVYSKQKCIAMNYQHQASKPKDHHADLSTFKLVFGIDPTSKSPSRAPEGSLTPLDRDEPRYVTFASADQPYHRPPFIVHFGVHDLISRHVVLITSFLVAYFGSSEGEASFDSCSQALETVCIRLSFSTTHWQGFIDFNYEALPLPTDGVYCAKPSCSVCLLSFPSVSVQLQNAFSVRQVQRRNV